MSSFFDYHAQLNPKRKKEPATAAPAAGGTAPASLTVSELTARIDRALRGGIPETVQVRGEISNCRPHLPTGHLYFTLKDANSLINCVMWKSDATRLKFTPCGGVEMLAAGNVRVYAKDGKYQLYVTSLRPLGQGALELAFQQLRAKLEAEGLFDPTLKKPLPRYPMTVILVTGPNTAALADMLKVLRRFPWLRLLIYPVPVQGDGAGSKIAAALSHLSRSGEDIGADVIVLGRGGGSLEDLWAFNEEPVARAIAACRIPIVTGIGHEVDTSIADLVADYHAHTPTEAAQVVATQWRGAAEGISASAMRLDRSVRGIVQQARHRLASIERHETFRRPLERIQSLRQFLDDRQRGMALAITHRVRQSQWRVVDMRGRLDRHVPAAVNRLRERLNALRQTLAEVLHRRIKRTGDRLMRLSGKMADRHPKHRLPMESQRLAALADRLNRSARASLLMQRQRLDAIDRQLQAISPQSVLRCGFSLTYRKKDGTLLRNSDSVKAGDRLLTRFAEGQVESVADDSRQPRLFE